MEHDNHMNTSPRFKGDDDKDDDDDDGVDANDDVDNNNNRNDGRDEYIDDDDDDYDDEEEEEEKEPDNGDSDKSSTDTSDIDLDDYTSVLLLYNDSKQHVNENDITATINNTNCCNNNTNNSNRMKKKKKKNRNALKRYYYDSNNNRHKDKKKQKLKHGQKTTVALKLSPSPPPPPLPLPLPRPSCNKQPLVITNRKEVVDIILRHERQVMSGSEIFLGYASTKMPKKHVECLSMFRDEMKLILREYARLRRRQQLLGSFNTNSINYSTEIIKKMIDIILRIDKNNMSVDKYKDVVREALYIYHLVVSKMTGPKHLKRLRTPELHFDFCVLIALLSHNVEAVKSISAKYRVSSIIQFVSALDCQWYLSVVPDILSVFNRSNSICQALSFSHMERAQVNVTLCLVFALTDTNTVNLVLGVILYLFPESLERIKRTELIHDESLIVPLSRLIMEHLRSQWISRSDITNAAYLLLGSCTDGLDTIKLFKKHSYDKKIAAVSVMVQQKLKQLNHSIYYH
uniref:Wsv282-like protein n=1 Tax=Penaeus semisulcatus majanivirus TaxID=2984274 RepID=A0A9C7F6M0_9VIRU|nr:MAG: wsv282-like protein [Penaeus semisulcatus majanivirus]